MVRFVIAQARWVIVGFAFFILVTGSGLSRLSIDPNNRVFFSERHEKFSDLLDFEAIFGSNTELVYVLHSSEGIEASGQLISALAWLTEQAWHIPAVRSSDSLSTYPHIVEDDEGLVIVDALSFACGDGNSCDSSRLKDIAAEHVVGRLISSDFTSLAVSAKVELGDHASYEVLQIASAAQDLKRHASKEFPDIDIYLTGGVPMMQAFFEAASSDSATLMPLVFVALFVVLWLFLGGALRALALTGVGVTAVIVTMGLAGWAGLTLNTATATAPLVIFTLVVASAMHLFMHIANDPVGSRSPDGFGLVEAATRANLMPIVLTALTTSIGFMSMLFVSAPPLRQLGVIAALGVVVGAILTIMLVPALFVVSPRLLNGRPWFSLQAKVNAYAKWLERAKPRTYPTVLVLLVCVIGVTKVGFDEDFVRYFSEQASFRVDTEQISTLMAGPYHIEVVYDSGVAAGIFSSISMRNLEQITAHLRSDERVVNVFSIRDVFRRLSEVLSPDASFEELSPDALAQLFLTYELSLDRGQSTLDLVDLDLRRARISVLLKDVSMGEIRDIVENTDLWAGGTVSGGQITITGEGVPTAYLSGETISEMSAGIAFSMVLSALFVGLVLRRPMVVGVMLLATIVPTLAGFGIWGWAGGDIGMAATLVIATTIGVVIDDTIHLVYRYIDGKQAHDLDAWGAAAYSIHKTGSALVATTIALSLGFLVLFFSQFEMNRTFGVCTSLVISVALIYNLTISPRLLKTIA